MNTKIIMTITSLMLGATGIILSFAPEILLINFNIVITPPALLVAQIIGALYFGYAMLNWMTKESLIGGIYNRPVAVANFTHLFIAALAIAKSLVSNGGSTMLWIVGIVYWVLDILFIIIFFRHPIPVASESGNK